MNNEEKVKMEVRFFGKLELLGDGGLSITGFAVDGVGDRGSPVEHDTLVQDFMVDEFIKEVRRRYALVRGKTRRLLTISIDKDKNPVAIEYYDTDGAVDRSMEMSYPSEQPPKEDE